MTWIHTEWGFLIIFSMQWFASFISNLSVKFNTVLFAFNQMLEVAKSFLQNILAVSILRWLPVKEGEYIVKVIFKAIGKLSTFSPCRIQISMPWLGSLFHILASLLPNIFSQMTHCYLKYKVTSISFIIIQSFSFSPPLLYTAFLCLQSHLILVVTGTPKLCTFFDSSPAFIYYT